jgi:hypothetical protein
MNVRRVVRVGGTMILVTGTALVAFAGPASAQPRNAKCVQINENVADEEGWYNYFDALSDAYARQGDTEGAASAASIASTYQELVVAGWKLQIKFGC